MADLDVLRTDEQSGNLNFVALFYYTFNVFYFFLIPYEILLNNQNKNTIVIIKIDSKIY